MRTLTKGDPIKLILAFSVPLFLGRLLQLFYTIVDTRIVGVYLGEKALAAVGGTSTLGDLMVDFMFGVTGGFAIISATSFGAQDREKLKKAVASSFFLTILITLFLSGLALLFMDGLLGVLKVPGDIYADAKSYITVIMAGLICCSMYLVCASVLRAVSDTVTPLIFLVFSTLLNVGLDLWFIRGMGLGVSAAALATVMSQGTSFVLCIIYMWKKYPGLRFSPREMIPDRELLARLLKTGLSMGFMSAFVSFGTVSLQTAINTFGTDIIVAHTAARKVTMIFMLPFGVFGQALATYCGQNMGAGEYGRIRDGVRKTVHLTWGWCLLVIALAVFCSDRLVNMVTGGANENILYNAGMYLKFDTIFYFVPTLIALIRNSLQGVGDSLTPVFSSFIEFAGKMLIALFLAPAIGYSGIIVAEPIVWVLMVIPLLAAVHRNKVFRQ